MSWKETKLGIGIHIKHGFAFKSEYFDDFGDYIVLTPGNFYENGGFHPRPDKDRYYKGNFPNEFLLNRDDLIIAMTEQSPGLLGSSAIIPYDNKYLHNQRLGLVTIKNESIFEKKFLYYLFNTHSVRGQIHGSASGTKVRHTAPERIYNVIVKIPDVITQTKISSILISYDNLIDINLHRIQLLEESVRHLNEEWFIRLRFPGYEHTTIVDGVPEGWIPCQLKDICPQIRDGVEPTNIDPQTPYIGLEHIPRRSISLNNWGKAGDVTSRKFAYSEGDLLFGKIRPYFHKVGITFNNGVTSSDAIVLRPIDKKFQNISLLTISSDIFVAETSKTAKEGSKMPRANWELMEQKLIMIPPTSLLTHFNSIIDPILIQLKTLSMSNIQLISARDLLLPRLISGDIPI